MTTPAVTASMLHVTRTPTQRAYLDFIRKYVDLHGKPPAEAEMQAFFMVTPPTVHQMVVTLTKNGFITREPGQARSIRLVEELPDDDDDGPASRPPDDITEPFDREIAPLVEALRADPRIRTKGSCWGHGKKPAYVDLAVEGVEGLRAFVERLNRVDRRVSKEALFDVRLNWSEEVVTACAFDIFPNWIMLSLTIEGSGRGGSPSASLLAKIAKSYRASATRRASVRRPA